MKTWSQYLVNGRALAGVALVAAVALLILEPVEGVAAQAVAPPPAESPTGVILDGELGEPAWSDAHSGAAAPSGRLLISGDEGALHLGLDLSGQVIGSVCVARGDRLRVLHASAALGTAEYRRDGDSWVLVQGFEWCCREGDPAVLADFLADEGWAASLVAAGEPGRMEYRIDPTHDALPDDGVPRFAVVALDVDGDVLFRAPAGLDDGCANEGLVRGTAPDSLEFAPDTWLELGEVARLAAGDR